MFVYGPIWSDSGSEYTVDVDGLSQFSQAANSSMYNNQTLSSIALDPLRFAQFGVNGAGSHTFHISNANGVGQIGFDYVKLIRVTGGTP